MIYTKFTFLRNNYSYDSLLDYMEKNIPNVKKSYKILNILKPYIESEMRHRLDYPETQNLSIDDCIIELNEFFMEYRNDISYRTYMIKETRALWTEMRTVGYTGRLMLRLSKLIY
jgi:hypothetical protein